MATQSSVLAWRIPGTGEPGGLLSLGSLRVGHDWSDLAAAAAEWLHFHFLLSCIGEGNGNPLQCSCLENPRDRGAWWAAVYGVAQSWTWLKWLSSSSRVTSLSLFTFMQWRRKWQPTPVFLPGESQGRGSLMGCCLWGRSSSSSRTSAWTLDYAGRRSWCHHCLFWNQYMNI